MSDMPSAEVLQQLVDQASSFDLLAVPDPSSRPAIQSGGGGCIGWRGAMSLRRFVIRLQPPAAATGVRAANVVGEVSGRLDWRWMMIPDELLARPDREPPPTRFDPDRSQRFAMQEGTFTLGDGGDGFHSFGAGRTFPMMAGGRPRLVAAAVGDFRDGFGRFRGYRGNFTLCGELSAEGGFRGHLMVRIVDPDGGLRTGELPAPEPVPNPDPTTTYLTWVAQKEEGPELSNRFSYTPEGEMRGVNIPVRLKHVEVDAVTRGGFRSSGLATGPPVGLEIGFGRETQARRPGAGTPRTPFQFEGVSEYIFRDPGGETVGSLTANFLEGRSIQMEIPGHPQAPALRFGYFGAIVGGKGCFRGVQGMIYGTAGSVFAPPPFEHVITNLYVARLYDPEGRFRA